MLAGMKTLKVLAAGLGVVVMWASAFPAIRVAAPDLGLIGLSFIRLAIAALALLAVAPLAHVRRPERRHALLLGAAAFFGMTAYQVLLNAGELNVPAGPASIVVASAPLVSVAIAALALGERLTVAKLAGTLPPVDLLMSKLYFLAGNAVAGRATLEKTANDSPEDPEPFLMLADQAMPDRDGMLFHAASVVSSWSMDDLEALADDEHALAELAVGPGTLASEVLAMGVAPERERAVAFSLDGRELRRHFAKRDDLDRLGLDDAERLARPVGDDAEMPGP